MNREPTTPFGEPTPDCTDVRCSRIDGKCVGYHCARCGEPCSSQGHNCEGELRRRAISARARGDHTSERAALDTLALIEKARH